MDDRVIRFFFFLLIAVPLSDGLTHQGKEVSTRRKRRVKFTIRDETWRKSDSARVLREGSLVQLPQPIKFLL